MTTRISPTEERLRGYIEFLEKQYGIYYSHYLKYAGLNIPSSANYWDGFKDSTAATINDLKDILGEGK